MLPPHPVSPERSTSNVATAAALERWQVELDLLQAWRSRLADKFASSAEQLAASGTPVAAELLGEMAEFRNRSVFLASQLMGEATHPVTLDELVAQFDLRSRQQLRSLLQDVLQLQHVSGAAENAPVLLTCQDRAARLLNLLQSAPAAELPQDVEHLRSGKHPLCAVLELVDQANDLSDDRWTQLNDQVTECFGRPLATAIARGRVVRVAHVPVQPTPIAVVAAAIKPAVPIAKVVTVPAMLKAPVALAAIPVARPVPAPATQLPVQPPSSQLVPHVSVFDDPEDSASQSVWDETPVKKPLPATSERIVIKGNASAFAEAPRDPPRNSPSSVSLRLAGMAHAVENASGSERNRLQAELVQHLLAENRTGLAFHLTRCLEERGGAGHAVPPSWLIHALALSPKVCYPKGEMSRALEEDFSKFRTGMLTEGSADWQQGISFLLRAATLGPALVASSTAASNILRSFRIHPGLAQLYNFCSRVAVYGDRMQGNAAEAFMPQCADPSCEAELAELRQETEDWYTALSRNAVQYKRSSPLFTHAHWTLNPSTAVRHGEAALNWSKWQEAFQIIDRLLLPVREQRDQERGWVRQEIQRLAAEVRVEPTAGQSQPAGASRGILLPPEMAAAIRDASDLAARWLRVSNARAATGSLLLSPDGEELRNEVLQRADEVLLELDLFVHDQTPLLVKTGVVECRKAICRLRDQFATRAPLPLREPDPRRVVHAELLKMADLRMDDHWMPTVELPVLERSVLRYLQSDALSWLQAFDLQCSLGDHVATGRLLELDVWSGPLDIESLRAKRDASLEECRVAQHNELREIQAEVQRACEDQAVPAPVRADLARRLQRLEQVTLHRLDFCESRAELNQLRASLERNSHESSHEGVMSKRPDANESELPSNHSFDIFSEN